MATCTYILELDYYDLEEMVDDRLDYAENCKWINYSERNLWLEAITEFLFSIGEIKKRIDYIVDNLIVNDWRVITKDDFEKCVKNFKENFTDEDAEYEEDIENTCDDALKRIDKGDFFCDEVKKLVDLGLTIDGYQPSVDNVVYHNEDGIVFWA